MTPDIQILSIVQIALIGILVVIGMFFLWRKIQRLEQKVEALGGQMEHCMGGVCPAMSQGSAAPVAPVASGTPNTYVGFAPSKPAGATATYDEDDEDDEDDGYGDDEDDGYGDEGDMFSLNADEEAIVQRMLQGGGMSPEMTQDAAATFMVFSPFGFKTAPTAPVAAPKVEIEDICDGDAADAAETESVSRPMTKTKLSKMNVEQLKAYLTEHQCATDGTKKQLFERALETIAIHA